MMLEQIKEHFKVHKTKYLMGGTFLVGVGVTVLYFKTQQKPSINTGQIKGIHYKSKATINNIYQVSLVRRGHPGNIIKCNETGEIFASQNRAAEALGVSRSMLTKHLKGERPTAGKYTFTKLGEAQ